jgi:uncharacterized protein
MTRVLPSKNMSLFDAARPLERLVLVPAEGPGPGFALLQGTRSGFRVSPEVRAVLEGRRGLEGELGSAVEQEVRRLRGLGFWPESPARWELGERQLTLSLHLAHACNLACPYCNVQQGTYGGPGSLMDEGTALAGVRLLGELAGGRSPRLVFYGGEPLLDWPVLERTVREAEALLPGCGLEVVTNGTLLDPERAAFLAEHRVFTVLSLDGPPGVHDRNRPMKGGGGSYARARRGLSCLQEAGARFHIRATWVPGTADYEEVLSHLAGLAGDESKVSVALEFDQAGGRGAERFHRALCERYGAALEAGDEPPASLAPSLDQVLRADLAPVPRCEAGRAGISVTPDGSLFPCQVSASLGRFPLGTVREGLTAAGREQRGAFLTAGPGCEGCWAGAFCSGPCVYDDARVGERPFCRILQLQVARALRAADRTAGELLPRAEGRDPARGMALRELLWRQNLHLRPLALFPQPEQDR